MITLKVRENEETERELKEFNRIWRLKADALQTLERGDLNLWRGEKSMCRRMHNGRGNIANTSHQLLDRNVLKRMQTTKLLFDCTKNGETFKQSHCQDTLRQQESPSQKGKRLQEQATL